MLPIYVHDAHVTTPRLDVPKRLEIDDALYERATNQCPTYLSTTGFINLILDQGLAGGARLIEPSRDRQPDERGEGSISTSSITSNKRTNTKKVNVSIAQHEDLIREFWKGKGGAKSETAWKLLMTELEKLQSAHGDMVVKEQLLLAINGKWKGVSASRYEQFKAPKGNTPQEQPNNHPAARVFTAADFDTPNPNNPLKELF